MKIETSQVALSATHDYQESIQTEIEVERRFDQVFRRLTIPASVTREMAAEEQQAALQKEVRRLLNALFEAVLAAMDGKKCRPDAAVDEVCGAKLPVAGAASDAPAGTQGDWVPRLQWRERITERLESSEKTTVCGRGSVQTCDGQRIEFEFSLHMASHFVSETTRTRAGEVVLRDPLVLNFDGLGSALNSERLRFDLDADGVGEWIPALSGGNAYLVLDRNGNGRADHGGELFGVASGNGFADLAALDGDGNGWIDEGDAAFKQLGLWFADGRWQDLKSAGVGALYTSAVDAPFSLKTPDNPLLGQIRAAGVYLTEQGRAGVMQQVDLAVADRPPKATAA